ncbi:MAG: ATP synthase F1 subunit delta [bacterium]|nr:ATP synthase F1 subunit delta [bacterium]
MKKINVVATKYAEALIKIAKPQNRLDNLAEELKVVVETVLSNERLTKILRHPSPDHKDKEALLKEAISNYPLSETTLNLLLLLLKKDRLTLLEGIFLRYTKLVDTLQNRCQVDVISSIPLEFAQEERLRAKLADILQAKIKLNVKINPKILGGLVLHIGDKIIDGSIIKRLFMLRKELI